MRKVKFEDILPKTIDMKLVLEILREHGLVEVGKIEGQKGFVILDEDEEEPEPLSLDEIFELVRYEYVSRFLLDYFQKHVGKDEAAEIDFKNKELIIYELDKDKEKIESMHLRSSDGLEKTELTYIS